MLKGLAQSHAAEPDGDEDPLPPTKTPLPHRVCAALPRALTWGGGPRAARASAW